LATPQPADDDGPRRSIVTVRNRTTVQRQREQQLRSRMAKALKRGV
jgi:hypothetical protein